MWQQMIVSFVAGFCGGFLLVVPAWVRIRSQRMVRAMLADGFNK